jgi:hypothetical protein
MLNLKQDLVRRPVFQTLVFAAFLSLSSLGAGCVSTGIRSTGANLPQAAEEFSTEAVRVEIEHNCSGGRCTGFDATFENLLDEVVEVAIPSSKITRAGESLQLLHNEKVPQKILTIPPKQKLDASFFVVAPSQTNQMTYAKPTSVWCSLKVDSACTNPSQGEAECAAAARAYFQQYTDLKGWIETSFAIKAKSWKKPEMVASTAPQFFPNKPNVELSADAPSPWWYGLNSQHTVFYRYACDAACNCSPLEKPRDFVRDDKFLPVPQE